jgi:xanthine dehydrogenase YagS FAD-binding subunit
LVSVAAALEIDGGMVRAARLAFGGLAHKPWRAALAEQVLRGAPATEASFALAAEAELAHAHPLRDNRFKIRLARNALVGTLRELSADGAR